MALQDLTAATSCKFNIFPLSSNLCVYRSFFTCVFYGAYNNFNGPLLTENQSHIQINSPHSSLISTLNYVYKSLCLSFFSLFFYWIFINFFVNFITILFTIYNDLLKTNNNQLQGSYLEGIRTQIGGITQKVKSWYWGRPLVSLAKMLF